MKRSVMLLAWLAALLLLSTLPAAAQSGCIDSPENPTAILVVVGTAGFVASGLRARYQARRAQQRLRQVVPETYS